MKENAKKRRAALLANGEESGLEGEESDLEGEESDPEDVGTSRYIDDLPDPDKYYGNNDDNSDDDADMDSGQFKGSRMRKLAPPSSDESDESGTIKDGDDDGGQESEEDDGQEGDPEQLALHLLRR